jgi:simple sugar transport system permease protein
VGFDCVVVFAILSVPALAWLLNRTGWGLATRASGERPEALTAAGWSVQKVRWLSLVLSGLLAGLAGAYLAIGVANSFSENMTGGRGFVAIALVTFGRWKPLWVALAALLVGLTETLQFGMQASGLRVPHQILTALPYLVALGVLIVAGKGRGAPDALGRPYRA